MDMARKFLQMGYTRSRRYASHKGSKKYDAPVPADKKAKAVRMAVQSCCVVRRTRSRQAKPTPQ